MSEVNDATDSWGPSITENVVPSTYKSDGEWGIAHVKAILCATCGAEILSTFSRWASTSGAGPCCSERCLELHKIQIETALRPSGKAQWVSGWPFVEIHDEEGTLPDVDKDSRITAASVVVTDGTATLYMDIERDDDPKRIRLRFSGAPNVTALAVDWMKEPS